MVQQQYIKTEHSDNGLSDDERFLKLMRDIIKNDQSIFPYTPKPKTSMASTK